MYHKWSASLGKASFSFYYHKGTERKSEVGWPSSGGWHTVHWEKLRIVRNV